MHELIGIFVHLAPNLLQQFQPLMPLLLVLGIFPIHINPIKAIVADQLNTRRRKALPACSRSHRAIHVLVCVGVCPSAYAQ